MRKLLFLTLLSLAFGACKNDPVDKIPALEQALAASYSKGTADSLVDLYLAAVKAHPDNHAANIQYLSKAAELRFTRSNDPLNAVRWLNQALKDHGKGQNLVAPVTQLTRIWNAYQYKSTPDLSKNPDDIDLMHANLDQNKAWIDSSLVALDKEMGGAIVKDKSKADVFIEVAEGYAALLQSSQLDKSVDLLLKAAGLAKSIGNPNKAIQLYYKVGEKMPQHSKAPTALFMMAFIYENDLKQLDKAKSTYELFLQRYPQDPDYADDAQNALKYLGMPAEEIIRQFEQQQK